MTTTYPLHTRHGSTALVLRQADADLHGSLHANGTANFQEAVFHILPPDHLRRARKDEVYALRCSDIAIPTTLHTVYPYQQFGAAGVLIEAGTDIVCMGGDTAFAAGRTIALTSGKTATYLANLGAATNVDSLYVIRLPPWTYWSGDEVADDLQLIARDVTGVATVSCAFNAATAPFRLTFSDAVAGTDFNITIVQGGVLRNLFGPFMGTSTAINEYTTANLQGSPLVMPNPVSLMPSCAVNVIVPEAGAGKFLSANAAIARRAGQPPAGGSAVVARCVLKKRVSAETVLNGWHVFTEVERYSLLLTARQFTNITVQFAWDNGAPCDFSGGPTPSLELVVDELRTEDLEHTDPDSVARITTTGYGVVANRAELDRLQAQTHTSRWVATTDELTTTPGVPAATAAINGDRNIDFGPPQMQASEHRALKRRRDLFG